MTLRIDTRNDLIIACYYNVAAGPGADVVNISCWATDTNTKIQIIKLQHTYHL